MPFKVLLVEDNVGLADEIIYFLRKRQITVVHVTMMSTMIQQLSQDQYDLVLLDRMLPEGDSLDFIDAIRVLHKGILMFTTALSDRVDRISGIAAGADYYLPKPIDLDELFAYVQSFMARRSSRHEPQKSRVSGWEIRGTRVCGPQGQSVALTMRELQLVDLLIKHAPDIIAKQRLVSQLGQDAETYDYRRLDSTIYRIRRKAFAQVGEELPIRTYHGLGYAWKG